MGIHETSSSTAINEQIAVDGAEEVLPASSGSNTPDEEKANGEVEELSDNAQVYIVGWKLHFLTVALCLCLFLSSLETTIVSTSLVSITNSLDGYNQASWIITAYLLTYTGFLIVWAKISDILGRKLCLTASVLIFTIASGACGAAQTLTQLIIFRAFQGIGGSGSMSLSFVIVAEMVPATKYALYGSITSFAFAIAYLLGPMLGGAINDHTTWRWIFLLNCPAGALTILLVLSSMPNRFPNLGSRTAPKPKQILMKQLLARVDVVGFLLLLSACAFLVVALEESGIQYAWSDPVPIAFLVLSGLLWIAFFAWSRFITNDKRSQEPVFSWSFVKNRVLLGVLLVDFLAGVPFFVTIIQIPQRYQIVNQTSAFDSGVRMLPFILSVPFCSAFSTMASSKLRVPPIFILVAAFVFQIVGIALLSTISVDTPPQTYGYEAILGIGIGLNFGSVIILTPNIVRGKDQSVAMGALSQLRALGGVIGLSIASNILSNHVKGDLSAVISPQQLDLLLQTSAAINSFPIEAQTVIRSVYADGYSLQMKAMTAFAAAQAIAVAIMWEKKLRRVA